MLSSKIISDYMRKFEQKREILYTKRVRTFVLILLGWIIIFCVNTYRHRVSAPDLMGYKRVSKAEVTDISFDSVFSSSDIYTQTDTVVPIIYHNFPDINKLKDSTRTLKELFTDLLVPEIMIIQTEFQREREWVKNFRELSSIGFITEKDSIKFSQLCKLFATEDTLELVKRLHTNPPSIVLAQTVIETGWGRSRFCTIANNFFGIWSFNTNEPRVASTYMRGDSLQVYVRKYDNLYSSIKDYYISIAKNRAYKELRTARLTTSDPYKLITHLHRYSEKSTEYVNMLRSIIRTNNFTKWDTVTVQPYNINQSIQLIENRD